MPKLTHSAPTGPRRTATAVPERPRRTSSRTRRALTVAALTAAGSGLLAQGAHASAYSCTGYGIAVKGVGLSQFCGDTRGSGTYVQSVGAGFSAPIAWMGWLTNTRVQADFINNRGQVYRTYVSSLQSGGSAVGGWRWTLNATMQQGTLRYTLLSNGASVASVSHRIG